MIKPRVASVLFAICLLGWGIQHFMLGDFIAGRAPAWPADVPGKLAWAYLTGLLLIVTAISIVKTRTTAVCTGLIILAWAGGRNLFVVLSTLDYGGVLTSTGKSFTIGFGALLVASLVPLRSNEKWTEPLVRHAVVLASIAVGIFFIASGIQHFLFVPFVKMLVPAWIPGNVFWTYAAGVAMIAAGIALITGIQRPLAALISSWMVFTWFLILHIPRAVGEGGNANEWTAVFEALSVAAILTIIYQQTKKK